MPPAGELLIDAPQPESCSSMHPSRRAAANIQFADVGKMQDYDGLFPRRRSSGNLQEIQRARAGPDQPRWKPQRRRHRSLSCRICREGCRFSPPRPPLRPSAGVSPLFFARTARCLRAAHAVSRARAGGRSSSAGPPGLLVLARAHVDAAPPLRPLHRRSAYRPRPRPPLA